MSITEAIALLPRDSSIPSYQDSPISDEWLAKPRAKVAELEDDYQKRRRYTLIKAGVAFGVGVLGVVATSVALSSNQALIGTASLLSSIAGFSFGACLLFERCALFNPRNRTICQIVMDKSKIEALIRHLREWSLAQFADLKMPISGLEDTDLSEFEILTKETQNRFSSLVHLRQASCCRQKQDAPLFEELGGWLQERWQALQRGPMSADLSKTQRAQV